MDETTLVLQESAIHNLVGCIDNARHVATFLNRLESQCQTTELLEVGLEEVEMLGGKKVQTVATQCETLGERERILDGQTHIGHTQLGLDGTILELHSRMDNALRVD